MLEHFKQETSNDLSVSWIKITPTVHKVLAHSWELIEFNDGVDLGALDKSGLQGCNKILRNIWTNISRKTSQRDNLVDTIRRMWVSSDPVVIYERNKIKCVIVCKSCNTVGHTNKSCMSEKAMVPTEDDCLFNSLIFL